jgi:hypothetical protein
MSLKSRFRHIVAALGPTVPTTAEGPTRASHRWGREDWTDRLSHFRTSGRHPVDAGT